MNTVIASIKQDISLYNQLHGTHFALDDYEFDEYTFDLHIKGEEHKSQLQIDIILYMIAPESEANMTDDFSEMIQHINKNIEVSWALV